MSAYSFSQAAIEDTKETGKSRIELRGSVSEHFRNLIFHEITLYISHEWRTPR